MAPGGSKWLHNVMVTTFVAIMIIDLLGVPVAVSGATTLGYIILGCIQLP